MTYKYGVCSGLLGEQKSRWMPYQPARDLEQRFQLAAKIEGLDGLEIGYPGDFQERTTLKDLIEKYSFEIAAVNLKVRGPDFMEKGSFTSPEQKAVETAIRWGKEALDAAIDVGCQVVTSCPLNDGFDYPFEMDYADAWEQMVDGIRQVAAHRDDVKLAIEYKLSDPRTRSLISNVGETLILARQTERPNVGVTIDFGHCLIARENPSLAAALAAKEDRLFHVHLNDNDRIADIDLVTGTVHFWETLEFLYYLPKLGYQGWLVTDVFPKMLDPALVFTKTIEIHKRFVELAEAINSFGLADLMKKRDLIGVFEKLQTLIKI
jgi:xylose isomerase